MGVRADDGVVLVRAVVVGDDGASADIGAWTDGRITDIGQVVGLGACAHRRVLDLDEVADMHIGAERGAGAQPRERPDDRAGADRRALDDAVGVEAHAGCDLAVSQHTARADDDAVAEHHAALEHGVDVDEDVTADHDLTAHIDAHRIGERRARHHQGACARMLHRTLRLGELDPVVDAEHLGDRRRSEWRDLDLVLHRHRDDVGEVVLTLGVGVAQLAEPTA